MCLTCRHYDCICSFGLGAGRLRTKPEVPCKDYVSLHAAFMEKTMELSDLESRGSFKHEFCLFSPVTWDVYLSAFSSSVSCSNY